MLRNQNPPELDGHAGDIIMEMDTETQQDYIFALQQIDGQVRQLTQNFLNGKTTDAFCFMRVEGNEVDVEGFLSETAMQKMIDMLQGELNKRQIIIKQ